MVSFLNICLNFSVNAILTFRNPDNFCQKASDLQSKRWIRFNNDHFVESFINLWLSQFLFSSIILLKCFFRAVVSILVVMENLQLPVIKKSFLVIIQILSFVFQLHSKAIHAFLYKVIFITYFMCFLTFTCSLGNKIWTKH